MSHEVRSAGSEQAPAPAQASLLTNGVTWYLRSDLRADGDRLRVTTPRTILGFLPIGTRQLDAGFRDVERIALGSKLFPERLVVALGLGALALFGSLGVFGTVAVAFATVAMLLLSFIAVLRIEVRGTRPFVVPVCLAHLGRARRFAAEVESGSAAAGRAGVNP